MKNENVKPKMTIETITPGPVLSTPGSVLNLVVQQIEVLRKKRRYV